MKKSTGKPLVVHDDSVVSRWAYLIEQKKQSITKLQDHLYGRVEVDEWKGVKREDIERELETERERLDDLFSVECLSVLMCEIRDIKLTYVGLKEYL